MDDRMRISDADREHVAARLRDHFAEGRLSSEELDERITATLGAKTAGDLRHVLADLPESGLTPPPAAQPPQWTMRPGPVFRRGPRLLPLVFIVLIAALVFHGAGGLFFAFLNVALVLWLVACLTGILAVARFRRHVRRYWQSGSSNRWRQFEWHDR
jgi:Domain of unknown function (DUF1707)